MAKFLTTASLNFLLEQLVLKSTKNLVLVSPYLKINPRLRELISDKAKSGVPVTVVYGKTDIAQTEKDWFAVHPQITVKFCSDLHAKCYMNEANVIVSSLNLYEFSQINNKEMGVLLTRKADGSAFTDAVEEVDRLVRNSPPVEFQAKPEQPAPEPLKEAPKPASPEPGIPIEPELLTSSKLGKKHGMSATKLEKVLEITGHLEKRDGNYYLTDKGKAAGGQFRKGLFWSTKPDTLIC
ncbi:phospholipase D family protein [Oceanobacter mangrovi]|uniref:phospholipase D family protein n=1 Tax=Oceanobacter mangrovi TaxID=2862510 RepID=UPI001C8D9040|nr:phospholipase D family protein [Oceanobacter mangrovi]